MQDVSPYNTRLFKTSGKDGKPLYELRLASVAKTGDHIYFFCNYEYHEIQMDEINGSDNLQLAFLFC